MRYKHRDDCDRIVEPVDDKPDKQYPVFYHTNDNDRLVATCIMGRCACDFPAVEVKLPDESRALIMVDEVHVYLPRWKFFEWWTAVEVANDFNVPCVDALNMDPEPVVH